MGRNIAIRNIFILLFFTITISSLGPTFSQTTRPICYTQISAANQACSILSPQMVTTDASSVVTNEKHHKVRDDDDGDSHDGDHEGNDDNNDGHDGDDDDHGDDHDDDDHGDDDHGDDNDDDKGHNHRGRKHHKDNDDKYRESSANKECCKWLQEVDNDCVCESLLRLPPFLVKPKHKYTIKVGRSCKLTFNCPGILHMPRLD